MHPHLGRNDLCHCGSGKKYKRCHLAEDEIIARERRAAMPQPLPLPVLGQPGLALPAPDPVLNEFEALPYDHQVERFRDLMDAGELDPEIAFEMVSILRDNVERLGDYDRFAALMAQLHAAQPDVYEHDLIWYHGWLLEDAVAQRATEQLPALFAPIALRTESNIDEVMRLIDVMLFHDQADALLDALVPVWPEVLDSDDILAYGKAELGATLMMLRLYRYLERGGVPEVSPALSQTVADLGGMDDIRVGAILRAVAGVALPAWTAADFVRGAHGVWARDSGSQGAGLADLTRPDEGDEPAEFDDISGLLGLGAGDDDLLDDLEDEQTASPEQAASNAAERLLGERLFLLLFEWAGWMWRERGVPLARVEVIRDTLHSALLNQPPGPEMQARLLPDRTIMDRQMAALLSFLSSHTYKAATLFALLPDYIDFLVQRGLASAGEAARARDEILTLKSQVRRVIGETSADPELLAAVRHAGAHR